MTLEGGKIKIPNRLWQARKRQGLGQKQVAFLIGKSIGEVSRYERGMRIPELPTTLALEVVYSALLRFLYADLFEQVLKEMRQRIEAGGAGTLAAEFLAGTDREAKQYCAYEEMLKVAAASSPEWDHVRDHVIRLTKQLAGL